MKTQAEIQFLVKEYGQLWRDLGVEELGTDLNTSALGQALVAPPLEQPSKPVVAGRQNLEEIMAFLGDCRRCGLCESREKIVFGSGNPQARLLFVGGFPSIEDDRAGVAFVDAAGQLLTKIIEAMGYQRTEVYLANVVKCRPVESLLPNQIAECSLFLKAQIESIQPEMIVALGDDAANLLTGRSEVTSELRGEFHPLVWDAKILVMPTFAPSHLLQNPAAKKMVWEDVKKVKARLENH